MARKAVKKAAPRKAASRKTATKKAAAKPAAPSRSIKVGVPAGKTITQSALMQVVADQTDLPRAEVKRFVEAYLDVVKAHVLKGVKVKLGDIGTILVRARKARMGRNPQTGEPVKIKASKKLAFRQSATMREMVR
ncbi:MAG: HU family DNA-binding protein [Hyphomonadaceae bacterium]|jgi:DNA-binding protein HU-beta|nr:HU family DNA-binding protein [Hyphomonadaceae bacterium]